MVTRSLLHVLERMEGPWAKDDEIISHGMIELNFRDQCPTHKRTHIFYGSVPEESANPPPIHDPGPTLGPTSPSINSRRTVKLDQFRWCPITPRQRVHQLSRAIECWKCMETMEREGFREQSCDMILVEDGPVEGLAGSGSGQMVAPTEISRDRSRRQRDCQGQVCTCTRTGTVSKELHPFCRIYFCRIYYIYSGLYLYLYITTTLLLYTLHSVQVKSQ